MMENGDGEIAECSALMAKPAKGESKEEKVINFDDIIDSLGGFGYWQRVIFVLISAFDLNAAVAVLLPVFTGAVPDWYCARYENSNTTYPQNETMKSCDRNGSKCVQFEFIDSFSSIVSEWNLVCDLDYVSDFVTTLQGVGLVIGAATFGQLSDTIGRKPSWFLANIIMLIGGLISAVVPSWGWYAAARVLVGIGFGSNMVLACVYPVEFVGRQWRVLCGTLGFWSIGTMAIALLAYYVREWKRLTLISTSTGILVFLTFIILPESPRWLNQHGKYDKAQAILRKIAEKNKKPVPTIEMLRQAANVDLMKKKQNKRFTYLDLFRFREYTKRTIIFIILWFTAYISYYWLAFNLKNFSGDRYLNMLYAGLVDQVAQFSPILFLSLLGRRGSMLLYLGTCLGCLIGILSILATNKHTTLSGAILAFALLGKSAGLGSTYVCFIFTAELYPTVIRNLGVGMSSISARTAMVLAPQFVYWSTVSRFGPYITLAILTALCLPLSFLLPETKGKPLVDAYPSNEYHKDPENERLKGKLNVGLLSKENGDEDHTKV